MCGYGVGKERVCCGDMRCAGGGCTLDYKGRCVWWYEQSNADVLSMQRFYWDCEPTFGQHAEPGYC